MAIPSMAITWAQARGNSGLSEFSASIRTAPISTCEQCGGSVGVVAESSGRCIEDPIIIARILVHLEHVAAGATEGHGVGSV
ncbi:MAG: hypothetical protein O7F73_03825 [Gammaproteobacteria bacterium]|nr:hypothetical protein [Gammaproteobacteria bacterium]